MRMPLRAQVCVWCKLGQVGLSAGLSSLNSPSAVSLDRSCCRSVQLYFQVNVFEYRDHCSSICYVVSSNIREKYTRKQLLIIFFLCVLCNDETQKPIGDTIQFEHSRTLVFSQSLNEEK